LDGEFAVYPGHPLVIAYLIVCKYGSYEEAAGIPDGSPYPGALGDVDIPGAGGNVSNALHVLMLIKKNGNTIDDAFARGDLMWGRCDGMEDGGPTPNDPKFGREHYLRRYKAGQDQADAIKDRLREKLVTWPAKGWPRPEAT
jgi:hypothetical protein